MRKSIFTREYQAFLALLRARRVKAGVTQVELAKRLRTTQSIVSKCERGERRLDVIELRSWCAAIDTSFTRFAAELDRRLQAGDTAPGGGRRVKPKQKTN